MRKTTAKILLLLMIFLIVSPLSSLAAAQVVEKSGSIFAGDPYYNSSKNAYTVDFVGTDVAIIELNSYEPGFGAHKLTKVINAADDGYEYMTGNNFTCNLAYRMYYKNAAGQQIGYLAVEISGLSNPTCNSTGAGEPPAPEDGKCDSCAVFECPAWGDYMGKLDDIQAAIPPPPNWDEVAGTFRDTIAPQIKDDMASLIGETATPSRPNFSGAPDAPTAPNGSSAMPDTGSAPEQPPALDDGGLTAPQGQEAPGLGDSSFNAGDVKDAATPIQENADPTGGFTINDPANSLPSQEEFIENADKMPAYEPENPSPTSPAYEPDNPIPTSPAYEPDNPAPAGPAYDPNNPAPGGPEYDDSNPYPGYNEPSGDYDTAPLPGDTTAPAPAPGTGGSTTGSTAPTPGGNTSTAPTPGGG